MLRFQNTGHHLVLQLLLLTTFSPPTSAAHLRQTDRVDFANLPLERQLEWREHQTAGPRCFNVDVPQRGQWWIELRSTQPTTHPSLIVTDATGTSPRTLERVEGVMFQVCRPGEHFVCLTSEAPLGDVELASTLLKGGDPMETEVEPNPFASLGCGGHHKGGDPMETEVEPNPNP